LLHLIIGLGVRDANGIYKDIEGQVSFSSGASKEASSKAKDAPYSTRSRKNGMELFDRGEPVVGDRVVYFLQLVAAANNGPF